MVRRGGAIIDPEILLVRERVITGDELTETITLVNASRDPVTVELALHFTPDATPMDAVKAGGTQRRGRAPERGWLVHRGRTGQRPSLDRWRLRA